MINPMEALRRVINQYGYEISSGKRKLQPKGSVRDTIGGWALLFGVICLFVNPILGSVLIIAGYMIVTQ